MIKEKSSKYLKEYLKEECNFFKIIVINKWSQFKLKILNFYIMKFC